ncbi:hypothetical protein PHLGIDRAFT_119653 [Phlebiopsis gigantea 11061_1 CR5-6]|uniref:Uncharacterized protein n=1 Tax=Phlebiopsis gigantea (strain 11061_1 CR5-6) TaxID=745531 RepID=A0A0C3PI36_PHLG1|nr:hypothetical protein PHLGIDRAFT_119653 [Phlebiopsis gigantea 11061_1 CR5-6]
MSSEQVEILQLSFQYLSTAAVIFATLSVLFGIYVVLSIFAIWATYRQPSKASRQLRKVTVVMLFVLCTHYVGRSVMFGQRRSLITASTEFEPWPTPSTFVSNLTTTLAGLISDGFLAWRMYVIYGRVRWALYAPMLLVIITTLVGLYSDFQIFSFYHNEDEFVDLFQPLILRVMVAWGWMIFGTNTIMTGCIVARIIYISRRVQQVNMAQQHGKPYNILVEAVIESALVTWVGLLVFEISSVAPEGHLSTHFDVGFVMGCIIPVFFGISQCLITLRLSLARTDSAYSEARVGSASSANNTTGPRRIVVDVSKVSKQESFCTSSISDLESGSTKDEGVSA